MSHVEASAMTSMAPAIRYPHEAANVLRLSVAQALAGANTAVAYATGAVVGHTLAPNPALATLPISVLVVGMAASTLPAGAIARRYGRRAAFLAGTGCGVLAGLLAASGSSWACSGCFAWRWSSSAPTPPWASPTGSPPPIAFPRRGIRAPCPRFWPAACSPG